MKSKGVFWGVLLVAIGALIVLRNFGVFYFSWWSIGHLWPVILVILGISILPIKGIIKILLSFLVVIASVIYLSVNPYYENYHHNWRWNWYDEDKDESEYFEDNDDYRWGDQVLSVGYDDFIENAVLDFDAAAGDFEIGVTEEFLLKFESEGTSGKYKLKTDDAGNSRILKLTMKGKKFYLSKDFFNDAIIKLHPEPVWDLNIDVGAAKIDFDLRPFKIDRVDIDGGASSIKINLGDKNERTDLRIDTGASAIIIEVPEASGCELKTSTVLSSKSINGFEKIKTGLYRTSGFDESKNRIYISIDAAVSSLKIERY